MAEPESELEAALLGIAPGDLPRPLPVAHLTAWRWLFNILDTGALAPRACKVFGGELVYLSYGGVFFRTDKLQTERASELPVALVLSPRVLDGVGTFYPFDSGAMASGRFGPQWTTKMASFADRFAVSRAKVSEAAPNLVRALYETNSSYLTGSARSSTASDPEPLSLLLSFLSDDLSRFGVDHRQRSIEALASEPIPFSTRLLWIGFPRIEDDRVLEHVYRWTRPDVPAWWSYPYTRNFNPTELAAQLEMRARQDVLDRYATA